MSRTLTRALVVTVVTLALGLAAVAPASAGPAQARRPGPSVTASLIANAWSVLQGFLTGAPARPVSTAKGGTVTLTPILPGGGGAQTMTGPCIDPMGRPVPCSQS